MSFEAPATSIALVHLFVAGVVAGNAQGPAIQPSRGTKLESFRASELSVAAGAVPAYAEDVAAIDFRLTSLASPLAELVESVLLDCVLRNVSRPVPGELRKPVPP